MSIEGRTWNNSDGKRNFPSGEIFTGPIEDSVEGPRSASLSRSSPAVARSPTSGCASRTGRWSRPPRPRHEDVLIAALDTDDGARFLGEIRLRHQFRTQPLHQANPARRENRRHRATWRSARLSRTPARSTNPPIHWDMICDIRQGGRVTVDGEPFLVDGKYLALAMKGIDGAVTARSDLSRLPTRLRGIDPRLHGET